MYERIKKITSFIQFRVEQTGVDCKPKVGIILGSGLGKVAELLANKIVIPYGDIDDFPTSTVQGHEGKLIFGSIEGVYVVCMQGRFHYYEGYEIEESVIGVRVMGMLGVKTLIVSNAAGGLSENFCVGDIMIIKDHINLLPNPLIGKNEDRWGERFPAMNQAYSKRLIEITKTAARKINIGLQEGVYLASSGPSYETKAEYKFFKTIGAHACGMSTVPEVIVANHMGIEVLGFSVITNAPFSKANANMDENQAVYTDHIEVQKAAIIASGKMTMLIQNVIKEI